MAGGGHDGGPRGRAVKRGGWHPAAGRGGGGQRISGGGCVGEAGETRRAMGRRWAATRTALASEAYGGGGSGAGRGRRGRNGVETPGRSGSAIGRALALAPALVHGYERVHSLRQVRRASSCSCSFLPGGRPGWPGGAPHCSYVSCHYSAPAARLTARPLSCLVAWLARRLASSTRRRRRLCGLDAPSRRRRRASSRAAAATSHRAAPLRPRAAPFSIFCPSRLAPPRPAPTHTSCLAWPPAEAPTFPEEPGSTDGCIGGVPRGGYGNLHRPLPCSRCLASS